MITFDGELSRMRKCTPCGVQFLGIYCPVCNVSVTEDAA